MENVGWDQLEVGWQPSVSTGDEDLVRAEDFRLVSGGCSGSVCRKEAIVLGTPQSLEGGPVPLPTGDCQRSTAMTCGMAMRPNKIVFCRKADVCDSCNQSRQEARHV